MGTERPSSLHGLSSDGTRCRLDDRAHFSRFLTLCFPSISTSKDRNNCSTIDGSLRAHLEQHVGEVAVGELEVSLVVELEQRRAVRVLVLQVQVVNLGLLRRVTAFLAHVHLANRKTDAIVNVANTP